MRYLAGAILLLVLAGCGRYPAPTQEQVRTSLTVAGTGKVQAGKLGQATLTNLRIRQAEVRGSKATVLAAVKAEQTGLGEHYDLSAELRLHYEWGRKGWELKQTEEVKPWTEHRPRQRQSDTKEPVSDSEAIQQLRRARKAARQRVEAIPYGP